MYIPSTVYDLIILFHMHDTAEQNKHKKIYEIGDIYRRGALEIGIPSEPIAFRSDTMHVEKCWLTLENTLFQSYFHTGTVHMMEKKHSLILKILHGNIILSFYLVQTIFIIYVRHRGVSVLKC